MAFFLLLESLLERLHDLVPTAEGLDRLHLFLGEEFFGYRLEPILGNRHLCLAIIGQHTLEDLLEHLVEPVDQALVLHEGGSGQVIERLRRLLDHVLVERLDQREVFLEAGRNPGRAKLVDEIEEHQAGSTAAERTWSGAAP